MLEMRTNSPPMIICNAGKHDRMKRFRTLSHVGNTDWMCTSELFLLTAKHPFEFHMLVVDQMPTHTRDTCYTDQTIHVIYCEVNHKDRKYKD